MRNWHTWDEKNLRTLLTKLYAFLRTTDIPFYFNTELCNSFRDICDGYVSAKYDSNGDLHVTAVYFDPRPTQPLLTVFIHELIHAVYPGLEEYKTAHMAASASDLLSDRQAANLYKRVIEKIK